LPTVLATALILAAPAFAGFPPGKWGSMTGAQINSLRTSGAQHYMDPESGRIFRVAFEDIGGEPFKSDVTYVLQPLPGGVYATNPFHLTEVPADGKSVEPPNVMEFTLTQLTAPAPPAPPAPFHHSGAPAGASDPGDSKKSS
jgi:hypothetical protein